MSRSINRRKKILKAIAKYWNNNPIELIKVILEIIIVFGFIPYLTYKQTGLLERQQTITETQMSIFKFEHKPRFQIEEYFAKEDSLGNCLTEDILIQNTGYPIDTKKVTIFSFFEISDENEIKTVLPVQFYYSIGSLTRNATGVLEAYTHTYNCKFYFELQNQLSEIPETYGWMLNRFHIIKIEWTDVLGENHTDFFTTYQFQPNQEMELSEAKKYITLHNSDFYINIQDPLDIKIIIDKVKDINYNKITHL